MAVQQHRSSKTRKRLRRTHFKLEKPTLGTCPQCGEYKLPHHACKNCGTYKGRTVIAVK
ncbi:50S ribosomal protein L32 [Alicyclobacillus fastidiosus]|uniref:50S ribosomal protein L32 n=2 Tax=Alicyclobacillus fastidiosus TaxID=392011 RepID=A0ABY6ZBY4_9BACL|nr:50S ribosomal protein L32 [Alicyclobacillus fastidiosus]WAH40381.1 50S ribosomal protein L32 [Alicyclobacillus fastidiosus]WEH08063.1 50S ribosomal protein L32 [Alicyclobacillus fastidiosus]